MSRVIGSLVPEWADVEELKEKLSSNWENGVEYGLTKNLLLETFIIDSVFEDKFNELNESLLKDLTEAEKREVLDHVKNILRNASEDNLLDHLRYGIEYTVKRSEKRTFRLIDFENPKNNSFIYGWEIKYPGSPSNIKPDFTLFINGIPLAIIEVKPSTRIDSHEEAIDQIRRYEQESPELFRYVQYAIAYGYRKLFLPTYPNWNRETRLTPAQPWKIEKQQEQHTIKVESIDQLLQPTVLLNIIKWFTFFREKDGSTDKIIGRYNQYIATEKALNRISGYLHGEEKQNGLVWHWQGSGKTYTMFFIANKYFEEYFERNPLIFFVVDRIDLQRQLREFIEGLKASRFKSYLTIIKSIERLKKEIATIKRSEYKQNIITRGIYIVLIQKFQLNELESHLTNLAWEYLNHINQTNKAEYEKIMRELESLPEEEKKKKLIELGGIQKREVLLLIDEAHRSQYGLLASMMKNVFPNAMRFAFTGTPVFKFEERNTFSEFAYPPKEYYLDVYFIKDSVKDGFTLPIIYDVIQEGKPLTEGIRILLQDQDIKRYIEDWIEASTEGSAADDMEEFLETGELPEETPQLRLRISRREIRQHLTKVRVFLTNEKRLKRLAQHIASRIEADTENFKFKAMIVTANREACVHMKRFLDQALIEKYGDHYGKEEIEKWTEIVMTYQHNDRGAILDYKEELIKRRGKSDTNEINMDVQREFKEEENPRILIVTDMLITGFDAPKLKVMYLDKPLYEHRLLQAIARVNRPYKDDIIEKEYGLIVDSIGLLRYVRESLRKFELIADERIATDIEENILGRIEDKIEEFKNMLKNLKEKLKNLTLEGRDLAINIDKLKNMRRTNKKQMLQEIGDVIDKKLRIIAAYWNMPEIQILLADMKSILNLYKALGSHPEKIHYVDDIELLTYIYGRILYYIKGWKVPREFWDGLIELIHEKTLVEDFRTIIKTKIDNDTLKRTLQRAKEIRASELIAEPTVADAYRLLRSLLEMDLANPVYKAIHEKVERAREEWIRRNITTTIFLQTLKEGMEEKIRYDEKIASKPVIERITETVNLLINQQFRAEKELHLNLEELRQAIPEAIKASRIVTHHENRIRTALMKDLFKEMRQIKGNIIPILQDLKNFAETVTRDYIIREITKAKRKGGIAA